MDADCRRGLDDDNEFISFSSVDGLRASLIVSTETRRAQRFSAQSLPTAVDRRASLGFFSHKFIAYLLVYSNNAQDDNTKNDSLENICDQFLIQH